MTDAKEPGLSDKLLGIWLIAKGTHASAGTEQHMKGAGKWLQEGIPPGF
jgi:hypothetical protein